MPLQSRTLRTLGQQAPEFPRPLPLVDLSIDTRAELTELVVRSGLKVLEALLGQPPGMEAQRRGPF